MATPTGIPGVLAENDRLKVETQGGAAGGTSATDKSAFVEGTGSFTPVGGVVNDTPGADPAEDQAAVARITPKRAIHVNLRDQTGAEVSVGGGTQYDEDTASAPADKVTMAGVVRKDAAATLVDLDGDRTQLQVDATGRLRTNNTELTQPVSGPLTDTQLRATAVPVSGPLTDTQLRATPVPVSGTVTASGPLTDAQLRATAVPVSGTVSVTEPVSVDDNAGTLTVDAPVGTPVATRLSDGAAFIDPRQVEGKAAHDAAASGNPVLNGAQMETMGDSAPGTRSGTDGDATKLATADGALYVIPTGPQTWSYHEDSSSALTDASVHVAPGVGLSLYVTDIVVSTGAATAFNIFFEEGVTKVLGPWYLEAVAGRGLVIHFGTPKKITANTALTVTTSAAIAHSIDIQGFIAPG